MERSGHENTNEIRRTLATCLPLARPRGGKAGRIPLYARPALKRAYSDPLDPTRAVGRRQRQAIERANPLSARTRSDRDRCDRRRADAIASRSRSSAGTGGGRHAGRFAVPKAGLPRPFRRDTVRSGFDFKFRAGVFCSVWPGAGSTRSQVSTGPLARLDPAWTALHRRLLLCLASAGGFSGAPCARLYRVLFAAHAEVSRLRGGHLFLQRIRSHAGRRDGAWALSS